MIVIGVDALKRTQTLVALEAGTGELLGQRTVLASDAGALEALRFGHALDEERVWAIEECRHVSGRFEQALIAAGEQVIRIPPALTSTARRAARTPGKSDPIDATAHCPGALREGVDSFPEAFLDEQAMDIRLLCDYRDQLITERVQLINRLRWHLLAIAPELEAQLSPAALDGPPSAPVWPPSSAASLRAPSCGSPKRCSPASRRSAARRFATEAAFARHAGTAPIPASSGNTSRHRLHRNGDRELNRAIHISPSAEPEPTPQPGSTSTAKQPKARPNEKPSAASNDTSPATSGDSSTPPTQPPPAENNRSLENSELANVT
jgi:transposase